MGTLRDLHPDPQLTKSLVDGNVFNKDHLVVVDVGARKGFEKHWGNYADQINLIGFEPNEESYKECIEKKSNAQTIYYPYALDRTKGEKDFYITSYLSACGFYKPNEKIVKRFGAEDTFTVTEITKVSTIDLDSFCVENNIKNVDFIKLDTEGSELDILKGAEKTLKSSVIGISIEVEFIKMYIDQPLFSDVDQYLRSLNFELYDLDLSRKTRSSLSPYSSSNLDIGQLAQGQALYLRDSASELDSYNLNKKFWNKTKILKMASIQEVFNLPDCAIELIQKSQSLDIIKDIEANNYVDLLIPDIDGSSISYAEYLRELRASKPRIDHFKKGKYSKIFKYLPWPLPQITRRLLSKIRDFINLFL
ncbi:FkbM family methyltransferase [Candidatus Thioglobus sp.]|nr:FkbM family methyltransferase [Candidatus Thioglobus sp.]MDA8872016.1 FkbM family methyltransferase [Candidatus Thioglobus sp.]